MRDRRGSPCSAGVGITSRLALALAFVCLIALSASAPAFAANLIANGDFEQPNVDAVDWLTYTAADDPAAISSWIITSGSVDHKNETYQNGPSQSVDLQGVSYGAIAQDLPTTPGTRYLVSYFMSTNTGCGDEIKKLEVTWNGFPVDSQAEADSNHPLENRNWTYKWFGITATQGVSRLQFEDASDSETTCGAMIDDVSVVPLDTPPPDTTTDTDGDAIADYYEANGYDSDGDGDVDLDLPAMGANPAVKDIFIEIDSMKGHVIGEIPGWVKPVADAFWRSGIRLHVDVGTQSTMNWATGAKWGSRSDANAAVPHSLLLGTIVEKKYDWTDFDRIKRRYFDRARWPFFHYVVSAHGLEGGISGGSRGAPASDFVISLGGCGFWGGSAADECVPRREWVSGTFMHELGHNLGLLHGGDDSINNKPNYLSVMNYSFQFPGLPIHGVDFSRAAFSPMDEAALNERTRLSLPAALAGLSYRTFFFCPNGRLDGTAAYGGTVDWNCNRRVDGPWQSDINGADGTYLTGFNDWANLRFDGGVVGFGTAGGLELLPDQTRLPEAKPRALLASGQLMFNDSTRPRVTVTPRPRRRGRARLIIRARDSKRLDRILVYVDGRDPRVKVSKGRRAGMTLTLKKGPHKVVVTAVDRAMNRQTVRLSV